MTDLPKEFSILEQEALAQGHQFLSKMRREWQEGKNRFDRENEVLLAAMDENRCIGIGGVNVDPYLEDPSVGRIRHVYVGQDDRSRGIGKEIMKQLILHSRERFRRLRLRTHNPEAIGFYLSLGFKIVHNFEDLDHTYFEMVL